MRSWNDSGVSIPARSPNLECSDAGLRDRKALPFFIRPLDKDVQIEGREAAGPDAGVRSAFLHKRTHAEIFGLKDEPSELFPNPRVVPAGRALNWIAEWVGIMAGDQAETVSTTLRGTSLGIDPEHRLITVFMVQHAGYPGVDGGKIHSAFTNAALKAFAK